MDQINALDRRLGIGKGAKRERERLNRDLRRHGVQVKYTTDGFTTMSMLAPLAVQPGNYTAVMQQVEQR